MLKRKSCEEKWFKPLSMRLTRSSHDDRSRKCAVARHAGSVEARHSAADLPPRALSQSLGPGGRRHKTAELTLDHPGESDRRAILQIGSNDLHPDRQAAFTVVDRSHRSRQPAECRDAGPYDLVSVGNLLPVDIEPAISLVFDVVMGKSRGRHCRAQHHVEFLEEFLPCLAQPPAVTAC